jgi:hypothetical protein
MGCSTDGSPLLSVTGTSLTMLRWGGGDAVEWAGVAPFLVCAAFTSLASKPWMNIPMPNAMTTNATKAMAAMIFGRHRFADGGTYAGWVVGVSPPAGGASD